MKTIATLLLFIFPTVIHAAEAPLWLACGPEKLLEAVAPLAEHRRAEGMETLLLPLAPEAALAKAPRRPDFLLIAGDDDTRAPDPAWHAPSGRRPFHGWQADHPPAFATDFAWGGLDRSGVPYVPTGRIPARTPEEAARIVAKIIAWEKAAQPSLSMPVWAGDPAYAPEYTERFMAFLIAQTQRHAPLWLEPWILSGDTRHPLAGPESTQARVFDTRTGAGALISGMIGHGHVGNFISFRRDGRIHGYKLDDARALASGAPRPPLVIIACLSGKFTDPRGRCLAEELVHAPGGPVLCVAATEESHPLPNFYTATCLLQQLKAADSPVRFGTLWLAAQRAARRRSEPLYELLLRDAEGRLKRGKSDVELLQTDQPSLYAILGDPATRLPLPKPLKATATRSDTGWRWEVGAVPGATRLRIERRTVPGEFDRLPAGASDAARAKAFEKANAALAFSPVAALDAAAPWRGGIEGGGIVRFIVETPAGVHAAGLDLR